MVTTTSFPSALDPVIGESAFEFRSDANEKFAAAVQAHTKLDNTIFITVQLHR
jgi:hypothetical protein